MGSEACGGGSDLERENIWAVGAHVGCHNCGAKGHFARDLSLKRVGKRKLFRERCPKAEENSARAARALGRDQQELAGFVADNTAQKNVQKDKGRPIILPNGVKVLGTMKYKNWQGLYEPLNEDQLSRQCRSLFVTEYAFRGVQHCGPSVTGSRMQGTNPSRKRKGSCARLLYCRLEHGPVKQDKYSRSN